MEVQVLPAGEAWAIGAAEAIAGWLLEGRARLGLAGGSTPASVYARLSRLRVPWQRALLWLGDERWVPSTDEASNQAMARGSLGAPDARWLAPDYPAEGPVDAAFHYGRRLDEELGDDAGVLLLGLGDDGHTLSLFPGDDAITEDDHLYVATFVADKETWRLTATLPMVRRASRLVFLVCGSNKAEAVRRVFDEEDVPATAVAKAGPPVVWLLDEGAASRLE